MATIKIDHVLTEFRERVSASLALAIDAANFKMLTDGRDRFIPKLRVYSIVELSFLRLYISWEQFLEETFIRYMCGATTASGYAPKRFVQPPTLNHALKIVLEGKPYVDWTRLNEVIRKAKMFFEDGEPFAGALGSASSELEKIKRIRNRITHRSEHSSKLFRDVIRDEIGSIPRAMGPGRFLLHQSSSTGQSYMQKYASLLLVLGQNIVR